MAMTAGQKQLGTQLGIAALQTLTVCIVVIAFFSFSGFLKGDNGLRGPAGGRTTIVQGFSDYMNDVLRADWNLHNEDPTWDDYGKYQNFEEFSVAKWYDYINSYFDSYYDKILANMASRTDMGRAANTAVRTGVDVYSFSSFTKANNYYTTPRQERIATGGSGIIYEINAPGGHFSNAYVITNFHVVSKSFERGSLVGADLIYVRLYGMYTYNDIGTSNMFTTDGNTTFDGREGVMIPARLIGGDPDADVAILEIQGDSIIPGDIEPQAYGGGGWPGSAGDINQHTDWLGKEVGALFDEMLENNAVASVTQSEKPADAIRNGIFERELVNGRRTSLHYTPKIGSSVISVGNALGWGMSVSSGIVSVQSEYINLEVLSGELLSNGNVRQVQNRVIRVDVGINNGNSGGGLFDSNGALVGLIQSRTHWSSTSSNRVPVEGVAYALPLDSILPIADQIIYKHENDMKNGLHDYGHVPYGTSSSACGTLDYIKQITTNDFFTGSVLGSNPSVKFDSLNYEMIMAEKVQVKLKGQSNQTTITEVRVEYADKGNISVTYDITRAYQLREIIVEAGYAGRKIYINNGSTAYKVVVDNNGNISTVAI